MSPQTRTLIQQSRDLIEHSRFLIQTSRDIIRASNESWTDCQVQMRKRHEMATKYPKHAGEIKEYLTVAS